MSGKSFVENGELTTESWSILLLTPLALALALSPNMPWESEQTNDSEWDDDLYDDVLPRQIYQAAIEATDPLVKEELIKEYEQMGGNHLEDLLQGRPAEDLYGDYPEKPPAEQAADTEYDREAFDQAFPDGAFGQGFDDLDANNDGVVSSSELLEAETNFENNKLVAKDLGIDYNEDISPSDLQYKIDTINELLGYNKKPYSSKDGKLKAMVSEQTK